MKTTPTIILLAATSILAIVLAGCIDSETVYHLNPDGSGKAEHRLKFTKTMGDWTSDDPARDLALGFVRGAGGIEAWDDVHYRMTDGGTAVEFRGVAYFRDVNAVSLGRTVGDRGPEQLLIPMLALHDEGSSKVISLKDPASAEDSDVDATVTMTVNGKEVPLDGDAAESTGIDTGGMGSAIISAMLLQSDIKTTVRIKGSISDANGFELSKETGANPAAEATFHYQPELDEETAKKRLGKDRKKKLTDKEMEKIFAGGIFENKALLKVMTGHDPPISAVLSIEKPSFDYESEVAAAEFPITPDESDGWTKLESLDP